MNIFDLMLKAAGPAARPKRGRGILKLETGNRKSGRYPTPIVVDRGRRVNANSTKRVNPKTVRSQRTRKRVAAWREKYGVLT